jgi:hypothetical protein
LTEINYVLAKREIFFQSLVSKKKMIVQHQLLMVLSV